MTGLEAYCAGYSAAYTQTHLMVMPRGMSEGEQRCWIRGLFDAFNDHGKRSEPRLEDKVALWVKAHGDPA